jgi:squalene-hopene/tetraprenyl-beta-curcumene cyclase
MLGNLSASALFDLPSLKGRNHSLEPWSFIMQPTRVALYLIPAACIAACGLSRGTPVHGFAGPSTTPAAAKWDKSSAAKYLDARQLWWQSWPSAQRDHGTICISCHTTVPYAMARPALESDLHQPAAPETENILLANVEKRVNQWSEMVPFYSDAANGVGKTAQSHSTEAVMNDVILTTYDSRRGHLRPLTRAALNNAWALQLQTGDNAGGWLWQDFHLSPWEGGESSYEGAAMLMLPLGWAPGLFIQTPEDRAHFNLLKSYLQKNYATQPLLNRLYVYWASAKIAALLGNTQRSELLGRILSLQQSDGGWRLASLDERPRIDKTSQPAQSDGLATALVALALEANSNAQTSPALQRGLAWLEHNQSKDGCWQASSLNKERDPESNIGKFMSDAATGYAVLALEGRPGSVSMQ